MNFEILVEFGIFVALYYIYKEVVRIRERVEMSEKEKKLLEMDEEAYEDYVAAKQKKP